MQCLCFAAPLHVENGLAEQKNEPSHWLYDILPSASSPRWPPHFQLGCVACWKILSLNQYKQRIPNFDSESKHALSNQDKRLKGGLPSLNSSQPAAKKKCNVCRKHLRLWDHNPHSLSKGCEDLLVVMTTRSLECLPIGLNWKHQSGQTVVKRVFTMNAKRMNVERPHP